MIVIVDDMPSNCLILQRLIKKTIEQAQLTSFFNALDAINFIQEHHSEISLIILDGNLSADHNAEQGPDIAKIALELNNEIPIASWTDDPIKKDQFAEVVASNNGTRYVCLNKPTNEIDFNNAINMRSSYNSSISSSPRRH